MGKFSELRNLVLICKCRLMYLFVAQVFDIKSVIAKFNVVSIQLGLEFIYSFSFE